MTICHLQRSSIICKICTCSAQPRSFPSYSSMNTPPSSECPSHVATSRQLLRISRFRASSLHVASRTTFRFSAGISWITPRGRSQRARSQPVRCVSRLIITQQISNAIPGCGIFGGLLVRLQPSPNTADPAHHQVPRRDRSASLGTGIQSKGDCHVPCCQGQSVHIFHLLPRDLFPVAYFHWFSAS